MSAEPIDLVYTWVDDRWPGYLEELRRHARNGHDLNPNRTRDNLDLLRYSLRSVALYAPWIRNVHLLTCRPQVPAWLNRAHPRLRITHHDEIMDAGMLPTFSSFAIITHLHRLPGVSPRFLYLEDDMLLGSAVTPGDLVDERGRIRVFPRLPGTAAPSRRNDASSSPWNAAIALANHLLDRRFGAARRRAVHHAPLLVDARLWEQVLAEWPEETRHTRSSRFRALGNVPPEYLYVYYALATGAAAASSLGHTYRNAFYFPLENSRLLAVLHIAAIDWLEPRFITMNDNFGARPRPGVVRAVRAFLERRYGRPSPFEL